MSVGRPDISGDDFGQMFAASISGEHRGKPLGLADVSWEGCSWSVKTVKAKKPFTQAKIRAISGRNSGSYSMQVDNPFADVNATGKAILDIWNGRIDQALSEYEELRIFVLMRNPDALQFTMFEEEAEKFVAANYSWDLNKNRNFIGTHKQSKRHCFTWQPHGSQFTIIRDVPSSAYRFRITKRPALIEEHHIFNLMAFDDSWVERVTVPPTVVV
jgi:hypothetical protein